MTAREEGGGVLAPPAPSLPAKSGRTLHVAEEIAAWTRGSLERLVDVHLRGFGVPRVFAGYPVGPDVRADLAYTLGLLGACGVDSVAGEATAGAIATVLRPIDGPATHTFFSYRVAETLARAGHLESHPWLTGFSAAERANLAEACDSTAWCALLDSGRLPANYAAVLARCEHARRRLGLAIDEARFDGLLARTLALMTRNPGGWHDDSPAGAGRYDIYTADLYLFLEPLAADPALAPRLGSAWERGARSALGLVERIAARNGAAFVWGRSTGALAVCLTIEMGALALARRWAEEPALWLAQVVAAFERFRDWVGDEGLISAHQARSPYSYRGPERRLQMTLDCLGKLAWAALALRREARLAGSAGATTPAATSEPLGVRNAVATQGISGGNVDEIVRFSESPATGVWAHRGRSLSFALPLVGSSLNDYLPTPQCPGLLEVPVEVDLPTGVPFAIRNGRRFAPSGPPASIDHTPGRLRVAWHRLGRTGEWEASEATPSLAGRCEIEVRVAGVRIASRARLSLDEKPDALALQVAETAKRRLDVAFACDRPHATAVIDTSGIKEYRSFWGELPRIHQIDVEPAREAEISWSVAPVLRVGTSASAHHYNRALYGPLRDRIDEGQLAFEWMHDPESAPDDVFSRLDLFHLHWPEWVSHDVAAHRALIRRLRENSVRVVWTQHNLVPHSRDPALADLYPLWAEAADGVIHHSRSGEERVRSTYRFRADAVHRVIPHPHFGHLTRRTLGDDATRARLRAEVERELELRPCAMRLGVVGAPRPEKDVQLLLDAFAAVRREDLGLLVLSLGPADVRPDDPRITALPYEMVARAVYDRRLAAIDVLVFPIRPGDLLTSGVVGDALGCGLPSIVSDWPYLGEALGASAIVYGRSAADLTSCLESLTRDDLARAGRAAREKGEESSRERIADETLAFLEGIGSAKL